jgi:hypothetical protein
MSFRPNGNGVQAIHHLWDGSKESAYVLSAASTRQEVLEFLVERLAES